MTRLLQSLSAGAGLLLLLSACANRQAPGAPSLDIVGAQIENRTTSWVSTVRVGVPATGRFVSCGNIAPGAVCATSFPELTFTGKPLEVTWTQGGQIWTTGEQTVQAGAEVYAVGRAMVRVVIVGPGAAAVVLLPRPVP